MSYLQTSNPCSVKPQRPTARQSRQSFFGLYHLCTYDNFPLSDWLLSFYGNVQETLDRTSAAMGSMSGRNT